MRLATIKNRLLPGSEFLHVAYWRRTTEHELKSLLLRFATREHRDLDGWRTSSAIRSCPEGSPIICTMADIYGPVSPSGEVRMPVNRF